MVQFLVWLVQQKLQSVEVWTRDWDKAVDHKQRADQGIQVSLDCGIQQDKETGYWNDLDPVLGVPVHLKRGAAKPVGDIQVKYLAINAQINILFNIQGRD